MLEDIDALAGVRLGPGTLYGALARLERLSLIEALPADQRRRPYRLTQAGVGVLRTELSVWHKLARNGWRSPHEVASACVNSVLRGTLYRTTQYLGNGAA